MMEFGGLFDIYVVVKVVSVLASMPLAIIDNRLIPSVFRLLGRG